MTKYYIEEKKDEGTENERYVKKSEEVSLSVAKSKVIKPKERIHICYHDNEKMQPCEVI